MKKRRRRFRPLFMLAKAVVRLFYPKFTVEGIENVSLEQPVVYVCNHEKKTGPTSMMLYFPLRFRAWVINDLTSYKTCREYLDNGFIPNDLKLKGLTAKAVSIFATFVCLYLSRAAEVIPVFRNSVKAGRTFDESMKALMNDDSVVIFPEKVTTYFSEYLYDFYDGFAHLGKKYYRETGKNLIFHPVYIDKEKRTIKVGKPEIYDGTVSHEQEKLRIVNMLRDAVNDMAVAAHEKTTI